MASASRPESAAARRPASNAPAAGGAKRDAAQGLTPLPGQREPTGRRAAPQHLFARGSILCGEVEPYAVKTIGGLRPGGEAEELFPGGGGPLSYPAHRERAHLAALEDDLGGEGGDALHTERGADLAGQVLYNYAAQILGLCERANGRVRSAASGQGRAAHRCLHRAVPVPAASGARIASGPVAQGVLPGLPGGQRRCGSAAHGGAPSLASWARRWTSRGANATPSLRSGWSSATANTPEYRALGGVMPYEVLSGRAVFSAGAGIGHPAAGDEFAGHRPRTPGGWALRPIGEHRVASLQAVKNGLGIAIVSGLSGGGVRRRRAHTGFLTTIVPCWSGEFYLVYHKNRMLTPAARTFLRELPLLLRRGAGGGGLRGRRSCWRSEAGEWSAASTRAAAFNAAVVRKLRPADTCTPFRIRLKNTLPQSKPYESSVICRRRNQMNIQYKKYGFLSKKPPGPSACHEIQLTRARTGPPLVCWSCRRNSPSVFPAN